MKMKINSLLLVMIHPAKMLVAQIILMVLINALVVATHNKKSYCDLQDVFNTYCLFGTRSKASTNPTMNIKQFDKIFRDLNFYDEKITTTDIAIIFLTIKSKRSKEINFNQFKTALEICNRLLKDRVEHREGLQKLIDKMCALNGPKALGSTKTVNMGQEDHLQDTSLYTGSKKVAFGKSGKGHEIKDRTDEAAKDYVGGYKGKGSK